MPRCSDREVLPSTKIANTVHRCGTICFARGVDGVKQKGGGYCYISQLAETLYQNIQESLTISTYFKSMDQL